MTSAYTCVALAFAFACNIAAAAHPMWPRFAHGSVCRFAQSEERWAGSCGTVFDDTPTLVMRRAPGIVSGFWWRDRQPGQVWAGEMRETDGRLRSFEVELYDGGAGAIRTEYGWFPVVDFHVSGTMLQFRFDANHEVAANGIDREILGRAAMLISNDTVWNRADDRSCPAGARIWSIYCAVEQATMDVTGGIHHRRPAMEVVRALVDERSVGRDYSHRLMDYNNDPRTQLADVHTLFAQALERMSAR